MSVMADRRAALEDAVKEQIKKRVKELLQEKNGDAPEAGQDEAGQEDEGPSAGSIMLFDEAVSKADEKVARIASRIVSTDFPTQEALDAYLEKYPDADRSKHRVVKEQKGPGKKDEPTEKRVPGEEEKKPEEKGKKEEKPVDKPKVEKDEKKPEGKAKKEEKPEDKKPVDERGKEEQKPKVEDHRHPTNHEDGPARQIAVKDALIDSLGAEAKDWSVHKMSPSQISKDVNVKFPDGTEKKYGDLGEEEKARVDKAVSSGLAASKGVNDYTAVTTSALKGNMANNLAMHDDKSVEETKLESTEQASKDNASDTSSAIRNNGRNLVRKYASALSKVSRPIAERYVDDMADAVQEALSDGSLTGVSQSDLDEFMREDVKRLLHQEVETRGRSLGDHGVRHVAGNVRSSMEMLGELQQHGVPVTGKQKLMAVAVMSNHDIGYTVGGAATDVRQSGEHKKQSKALVDQESGRYDKIFGSDDSQKIRDVILTHDSTDVDWEKDPMASAVRLADNTALFGKDKVQDLFIRSPKAMTLACKLKMAAEMIPAEPGKPKREKFDSDEAFGEAQKSYDAKKKDYDEQMADPDVQKRISKSKDMQKSIKSQLHDAVSEMDVETLSDAVALHAEIDEMSEGKFSTSKDVLSRYSGKLKGFKFDPSKKIMNISMAYSPEGEVVDSLFGDEVATAQFDKFAGDMQVQPMRGKRGRMTFKNPEGKRVAALNIEGFDEEPIDTATTGAMRDFLKQTARGELRQAAGALSKPGAGEKEVEKAKKAVEKAKDKFTDKEWEMLMKALDEGKDVAALAKRLGGWPFTEAEMKFLEGKTASTLRRMAAKLTWDFMGERVARAFMAARGFQVNRKDKDTMSDTGGTSKGRAPESELKPGRDERNPWRTKNKTKSEKDPDMDRAKRNDQDLKLSFDSSETVRELARWPRRFADAVNRARA